MSPVKGALIITSVVLIGCLWIVFLKVLQKRQYPKPPRTGEKIKAKRAPLKNSHLIRHPQHAVIPVILLIALFGSIFLVYYF